MSITNVPDREPILNPIRAMIERINKGLVENPIEPDGSINVDVGIISNTKLLKLKRILESKGWAVTKSGTVITFSGDL